MNYPSTWLAKTATMLLATTLLIVGFGGATAAAQDEEPSIADIATEQGNFGTLLTAAGAVGLDTTLADCEAGPLTVLAPTDAAFERALGDLGLTAQDLLAQPDLVEAILQYHVLDGEVTSDQILALDGSSAATLQGEEITVSVDGETITIQNGNPTPAVVTAADIMACNGVVHVIDNVMLAPSQAAALTGGDDAAEDDAADDDDAAAEDDAAEDDAAEDAAEDDAAEDDAAEDDAAEDDAAEDDAAEDDALAETGVDSGVLFVVGFAVLAAGVMLVSFARPMLRTSRYDA